ncbi:hypothetical protein KOR42_54840 [Thalassoglobus neptunius]|uniref:Uncharacterized protein n=1 Tax=Thalassoglobus neptunius TaxID=1938619 RepID=A0A5C5UWR9_9PLAN|nr:hypothetical protein [Thalassoglobus neptunius]TWT29815.1 hypothetical protein KOR42_54840 [Thalassoglobus neptunius]
MAAHCYMFSPKIEMAEVEASLLLSVWAVESLHGESRVRLESRCQVDDDQRTVTIDAGSDVGRDLNRIFVGFLHREFSPMMFEVRPVAGDDVSGLAWKSIPELEPQSAF